MTSAPNNNLIVIETELSWLQSLITARLNELRGITIAGHSLPDIRTPVLEKSHYTDFILSHELSEDERLILILSLAPYYAPELLDSFFCRNPETNQTYTQVGGVKGKNHIGFLPTMQTALFLLAGNDPVKRLAYRNLFSEDGSLQKKSILHIEEPTGGEPTMSRELVIAEGLSERLLSGKILPPVFGNDFPAKQITSGMEWQDLILAPVTKHQVEEVKIWLRQRDRLMNELGMAKRLKPGNKILFYGPPGTGKTLTASLLGKYIQKDVYRIDLSMIVSKYIGETEKNLAKVFNKARHADWILFFDEADALFGSRTKVSSSHDRYANQEVSYLLQRIEDYAGIVILATNMKGNIDDAFMRRFNGVVNFPFPKAEERKQLWKKAFSEKITLTDGLDLHKIAEKYEIAGGPIVNIAAWCQLMALEKNDYKVTEAMLREGLARELAKEGRTL
jgi:hypothetical protein